MYNFKEVENKWQKKWYSEGTFNAKNDFTKKKWYGLQQWILLQEREECKVIMCYFQ